ncbi:hypothetical protein [Acetobacter sp. KSO5]|uniref:hypothetical protein n=1 Tax=Acetobacter sp. KSO5 TaxID=3373674 RepID=UPI00376F4342
MTSKPTAVVVRLPLSDNEKMALTSGVKMGGSIEQGLLAIGTPVAGGELKIWGNVSRENAKDLGPEQAVLMFGGADTGPDDINLVDAEAALAAAQAEIAWLRDHLETVRSYLKEAPSVMARCGALDVIEEALKGPAA